MKTEINLLITLLSLTIYSSTLQAQWIDVTPADTSFGFGKMSFINDQIGFVAGNSNNSISKTIDGGSSWTTIQVDSTLVSDLHFVSPLVGYVAGNVVFPTSLRNLSKTIDGGITWQAVAPEINSYSNVYFKDANVGFVTAQWGATFKTVNAGISWIKVDSSSGNDMLDKSFYSASSDTAYFAGWDGTFAYQGVISKTTDNGNTWTNTMPIGWNSSISSIHMINGTSGFFTLGLWGSPNGQYIYKTQNGFASLDSILKPVQNVYDIFFTSMNEGYLLADSGIYSTNNGGISFVQEQAFTNGIYIGKFERAENTLYATNGSKVFKKQLITGVHELASKESFVIFPNPSNSIVFIEGTFEGVVHLLDITGNVVKQIVKNNFKTEFIVSDLSKGIYFIKSGINTQKLIVN